MRIAFALLLLLFGVGSVRAESHIKLSCSHGHTEKKTTFADGHMQTQTENAPGAFQIDVDLENKSINRFYENVGGQRLENGSVNIGGLATKQSTEHESGYQDTISIDRLSGTAIVMHMAFPSDDCADRLGRDAPSCRTSKTTTIYQCDGAAPRFARASATLHVSATIALVRRGLAATCHWVHALARAARDMDLDP
jgi:hypothetical protein